MKISAPLPAKVLALSESLSRELDPELRGEGYLRLANKLSQEERWAAASEIYGSLLAEASLAPELRKRAQADLDLLSGRGTFGRRFEFWSRSFVRHAADPTSLAAMTAGGLAFRAVRLGVAEKLFGLPASFLTRGFLATGAAGGAGFSAEVLAFASIGRWLGPSNPNSWSHDLALASLSLGALKLTGAASSALIQRSVGTSYASKALAPRLLQQSALFAGILLGASLEKKTGLRVHSIDLWEGLGTLLHFNVGGALSRRWLGEKFARWESGLDQRFREMPTRRSINFGPRLALAGAVGPGEAKSKGELPELHRFLAERHGSESGLTPPVVRDLEAKYLRIFPPDEGGFYSQEIVHRSCRIRCDLPGFHENLLEALTRSPRVGQLNQLYTVLAIEKVFNTDALGSSRGSFAYAPLQLLLGHVLSESNAGFRHQGMQTILSIFERGFSRSDSNELLQKFTRHPLSSVEEQPTYDLRFHTRHTEEAARAWQNFRPQDVIPLFNFVHAEAGYRSAEATRMIEIFGAGQDQSTPYFAAEIDRAFDYARVNPYGSLVLRRLLHILESSDHPSKLREISGEPSKIPTDRYVEALAANGHSIESIAQTLNGSVHTAYFNDMRLAEKVVLAFRQAAPYLQNPTLREDNRARLTKAILEHAAIHRRMGERDLFRLLEVGAFPSYGFFERAWKNGEFNIEILSDRNFRHEVDAWGKVQDCEWTLYQQGGRGDPDRILIRELPPLKIRNAQERDQTLTETVWRLRGLVHELEHWGHFSGKSEAGPFRPFKLIGISREERLITEIMAYMEEFSWRAMNTDDHFLQISRRLGDTLSLYLRNTAEQSYY